MIDMLLFNPKNSTKLSVTPQICLLSLTFLLATSDSFTLIQRHTEIRAHSNIGKVHEIHFLIIFIM